MPSNTRRWHHDGYIVEPTTNQADIYAGSILGPKEAMDFATRFGQKVRGGK
jgi:hypothetical protein